MKASHFSLNLALLAVLLTAAVEPPAPAQSQQPEQNQEPAAPGGREGSRRGPEGRGRGVFGKISAIQSDRHRNYQFRRYENLREIDGAKPNSGRTDSRRSSLTSRSATMVVVRIDPNAATVSGATALMVASAPQGFAGRGGEAVRDCMQGTMGKDFVVGEVKSVDAPKLTVLRTDNVTQTLELNEETSLRRGRDSITMADIQAGDHIFARGAMTNDVFVPKDVNVISPEQWKRMQEMSEGARSARTRYATASAGAAPLNRFFRGLIIVLALALIGAVCRVPGERTGSAATAGDQLSNFWQCA